MSENINMNNFDATSHLAEQASSNKSEELRQLAELSDDPEMTAWMERYAVVAAKAEQYGLLSLNAEEHHAIGSTPPEELDANPGKAHYEVLTEAQIEKMISAAIKMASSDDPRALSGGFVKAESDWLERTIPFLRSVGRLPEKYKNFDVNALLSRQSAA